jgi:hypothetical protein
MSENSTKLERILKWIVLVIAAVIVLKLAFGVLALAWVLGGFLIFKILPLVLLVWVVLKLVEWWRTRNGTVVPDDNS